MRGVCALNLEAMTMFQNEEGAGRVRNIFGLLNQIYTYIPIEFDVFQRSSSMS